MIKKLRIKFIAINMSIVSVLLFAIFGMIYSQAKGLMKSENIEMMKTIVSQPFMQQDRPDMDFPDGQMQVPYFVTGLDHDGNVLYIFGEGYDTSDTNSISELISIAVSSKNSTGVILDHSLRFYKDFSHQKTILVFSDIRAELSLLSFLFRVLFVSGLFCFFIFFLISEFLARWALKPVAAGWAQQKQFIRDASHELKTPLTVIMTNTELLSDSSPDDKDRDKYISNIQRMSLQMKSLVEEMLTMAKTENADKKQQAENVDFSKIVNDAEISFEGVFAEKGVSLESDIEDGIHISGSRENLTKVVDILLDNAAKYSYPDTVSAISLSSAGRKNCILKVKNTGTEIAEDELESIFNRFYRSDKARTNEGSFGLGLSIAKNIVSSHKGKIWAESENGINTFLVTLPKTNT